MPTSETGTRPAATSGASGSQGNSQGKAREGRIKRRFPKSLAAAAHVTAAGIWTFVAAAALMALWISALDGVEDLVSLMALLLLGLPILLTAFVIGLAVAAVGAAVTLPLAVVWFRTPNREGNGGFAIAHLAVATLAGVYVLLRVMT